MMFEKTLSSIATTGQGLFLCLYGNMAMLDSEMDSEYHTVRHPRRRYDHRSQRPGKDNPPLRLNAHT